MAYSSSMPRLTISISGSHAESEVDRIESDVELLIDKCQEYNVSEDKFDNLSVALDYLQKFRKEMEIGRNNCRNAYVK